jgi:hypothetical protein
MSKKKAQFVSGYMPIEHGATEEMIESAKKSLESGEAKGVDGVEYFIKPDCIIDDALWCVVGFKGYK